AHSVDAGAGYFRGEPRLGRGPRASARLAPAARPVGAGGRDVAMAGAHGDRGAAPSRPGLPRLPGRHPVPPDRGALHAILGPSASALVLHWRDADDVAASPAGIAVGAAGMEAAPEATRCALPAAIGVVGVGRPVLLDSPRQARRLHHAGAADGLPRARAVAAGHRAQVVGATTGTRIRTCVHPGDDGCRAGHAAGSYWFRGQTDRRARPAARCGAAWLDAAGAGGGRVGQPAVVRPAPADRGAAVDAHLHLGFVWPGRLSAVE